MLLMVFLHSITHKMKVKTISCDELANQICSLAYHVMCIDTRSMLQYNDNHVRDAINICCSKIIRRKLQYNRISVVDLIKNNNESQEEDLWNRLHQVVLYDEASWWGDGHRFNSQHALYILVEKLKQFVPSVALLDGGFSEFAYKFPKLCDSKIKSNCPLLSISTPCASAGSINCPPTKILPFLYLGCEEDALSEDILKTCHVKYVLNASHSAVDSPYCTTGRYLRIPIKDNSSENIVAWFQTAFDFIDKVKESDDHILIHCVGGVSRSATIAIAYVMKHFSLSLD
uniref:protein-tyrosine-phosphatase n=2 Tax=Clytia hemisphaerica TaxID=252671 RepID=A0A7M5WXY9_9CNID